MSDFTFTIIKPEIVSRGLFAEILKTIIQAGFRVSALKLCHMTTEEAMDFYQVHQGKPFFDALVKYMSSGPVVVAMIEKENAVTDFRNLIGNTNPLIAEEGTIRKMYGTDITHNAIHGSDSNENAVIESAFFFSGLERY
jgi:nucleoside-diphosphate kinase